MTVVETIPMVHGVIEVDHIHGEAAAQLFRRCRITRTLAIFVIPVHRIQGMMTAHVTAQHPKDLARDLHRRRSMVPGRQVNVRPRTLMDQQPRRAV